MSDELDDILKCAARENLRDMGISERSIPHASNELTESLCHEGEKDWQIDQLLEYLHYDPETKSHPDWVARAQAAEAEVERLTRERQGWVDTAAEFARNMEYYQGLVDRIGRAIGREAYIADDGSVSQDVLRAKVPEIVERVLSERNQSPSETTADCSTGTGGVTLAQMAENMKLGLDLYTGSDRIGHPTEIAGVAVKDGRAVVYGSPATYPEDTAFHNCDEMGCGLTHALWRGPVDKESAEKAKAE